MTSFDARPHIRYSLGFRLLEGLVFAPFVALVGQLLRGQVVVDSTALVGFFLSPRGFAAALISAAIFLTVRLMEHAGLAVLVAAEVQGQPRSALWAFTRVLARSRALARVTLTLLGFGLAALTPLALAAGVLAHRLLARHDINFYLQAKPPAFIGAAILLSLLALITAVVAIAAALRWRWLIQVVMFESGSVAAAFRRSAALAKPVRSAIAWRWAVMGILNAVLGAAAAWSSRLFLPLALGLVGDGAGALGFVLGALWVMQALIAACFTLLGAVLEAHVFTRFYFRRTETAPEIPAALRAGSVTRLPLSGWASAAGVLFLIIVGGGIGSLWGSAALLAERPMIVIAHRASLHDAPENTVPAIRQAIDDGADVAEIDVQLSRDGVVVVAHDSDFSRTAGVAKRVSDLRWDEIKKIDVGRAFSATLGKTRPARLDEVLAAARGKIGLNIELKHYHPVDGRLEKSVVALVKKSGMAGAIEIQSLEYDALMRVRRLAPELPIGYLMSVNARHPEKLPVDFLSVQLSRVDTGFLRRAHRRGLRVYVWTVDEEKPMEKVRALGVDGLITNRARQAAAFEKQWAALPDNKKALQRLRFWLAQ